MDKKEYLKLVGKVTPKEDNKKDYLNSFLMGGLIGFFSELLKMFLIDNYDLTSKVASNWVILILIFNQSVDKKSAQKPYMRAFA